MNIKYTCFKSLLKHSSEFEKENESFIKEIEDNTNIKLVSADISDYDCDLKLLFIQTGGSEGIFLENLDKVKSPFLLLTNGGNNSLAASLEILTYVKLHGYNGEILHGDSKYIAQRITELAEINIIKKKLSNTTLGVIGAPSDWLISSIPTKDKVKDALGINLKFLSLDDIQENIETENTINDENKELQKANKVYLNAKRIINKFNLNGITIRCFDLLSTIKMTGCLALSKLNDEGIIGTCEGDVMAMISMHLVKTIFDQPSFQANPSRIDTLNNEITLCHCTIPLKMVETYSYLTHFESGIGLAIRGKLKKDNVTIFRLSSSLKDYTILEGEIIENSSESNLCRTQIKVKCNEDVSLLLTNPCGNHHIIFYGHHKNKLERILKQIINK